MSGNQPDAFSERRLLVSFAFPSESPGCQTNRPEPSHFKAAQLAENPVVRVVAMFQQLPIDCRLSD